MRVVHVASYDTNGGAPRATIRLHRALAGRGAESRVLVREKGSGEPGVEAFVPAGDPLARLRRRLRRERIARDFRPYRESRPAGFALFSDDRTPFGGEPASRLPPADVVHLHWVAGFVDIGAFFASLPAGRPVVFTLHDMNPFTGGCHVPLACGRYDDRCGACPQLGSADPGDLSRRVWERKRDAFGRLDPSRLHVVAPSRWMAERASRSALLGRFPVTVIPNGVDLAAFAPRDRGTARDVLALPRDARVLLFVGGSAGEVHKGWALLREALAGAPPRDDVLLVTVGGDVPALDGPVRHVPLGPLRGDRLMSLAYGAADLLVLPSLQDNYPNTAVEAVACGTPVAAFAAGGIPEIVRPGETGALAAAGDPRDLLRAVLSLLDDDAARRVMARRCREVAAAEHADRLQAERHVRLYEALLEGRPPGTGGGGAA